jgi:hypothetical protein
VEVGQSGECQLRLPRHVGERGAASAAGQRAEARRGGVGLTKIAEEAMRAGSPRTPPGLRLILTDIRTQPGSSIGQIAARTGLPQSYVSESVARLRDQGVVETWTDPTDRRRTRVRIGAAVPRAVARAGGVSIDAALIAVGGSGVPDADRALIADLEALAARLAEHRSDA